MALRGLSFKGTSQKVTATGSITGASTTGAFTYGALTYTDTNNMAVFETSVNSYAQVIAQNASNGATASSDFVVNNDVSTATTFYGDWGMNSSGFSGSGSLNLPSAVYLSATSSDLVIGTTTANTVRFLANGATTDAATVSTANKFLVQGIPPLAGVFGTGSDGAVAISSGTTTITRPMNYTNLTMSGTGVLNTNGFPVFVSGTLDISAAQAGAIISNGAAGNNASGATGGAGMGLPGLVYQAWLPRSSFNSLVGATGGTGIGANGVNAAAPGQGYGGYGGASGAGGAGVSAGGTAAGISSYQLAAQSLAYVTSIIPTYNVIGAGAGITVTGMSGSSGSAGGGDGINSGGGGGGGGLAGHCVAIYAATIARGSSVVAGIIQAKGGAGGNGGNATGGVNGGGGGGAGGAGGGFIYIVVGTLTGSAITNALDASGGTGGTGGNGLTSGKGGNGGQGGYGGSIIVLSLAAATITQSAINSAGTAGSTTATATGAAGGAGFTLQANL